MTQEQGWDEASGRADDLDDALAVMKRAGSPDTHVRLLASQLLWLTARETNLAASAAARSAARQLRRQVYALLEAQIAQINGSAHPWREPVSTQEAHLRFSEALGSVRLLVDLPGAVSPSQLDGLRASIAQLAQMHEAIYKAACGNPDFPAVIVQLELPEPGRRGGSR